MTKQQDVLAELRAAVLDEVIAGGPPERLGGRILALIDAALVRTPETRHVPFVEYRTTACHSGSDGDCVWSECPQIRDGEPVASGRHCPLDAEPRAPWSPAMENG